MEGPGDDALPGVGVVEEPVARRAVCGRCGRPEARCPCDALPPPDGKIATATQVFVLVHPCELKRPLRTVPMVSEAVERCTVVVARKVVRSPALEAAIAAGDAALLWPAPDAAVVDLAEPLAVQRSRMHGRFRTLVVVDGTWKQAQRLLSFNPALRGVPRLRLDNAPPSRYFVRKQEAGHLCTAEAIAYALMAMEPTEVAGHAILAAFERLVALSITDSAVGQRRAELGRCFDVTMNNE